MKIIQGNLIHLAKEGAFDVIIHGCNCFCAMGNGIAKDIRREFPEAYAADLKTKKGDRSKLGTYSSALIVRGDIRFTVVNAYTQYDFWTKGVKADYAAIAAVMAKIKADFSRQVIGYPKIGAGLARGDWDTISKSIDSALLGEDHTLVEFVQT